MIDFGSGLRRTALVAVAVLVSACGGRHGGGAIAPPAPASTPSAASLERLVDTKVAPADRALLLTMARRLPAAVLARATAANTTLAIAVMDDKGHVVRQFSNRSRPVLVSSMVRSHARQRTASAVNIAPADGQVAPQARQLQPRAVPAPGQGSDLYHTLTSTQQAFPYTFAHVTLPCRPTLTGTDTPYIAFGGYTDTANNLIESGEQFVANSDPALSAYQPYIRYGASPRMTYPGNGTATGFYTIQAQSGAGDGSTWICGANQTLTIFPEFFVEIVPTGSVPTGPTFGTLVTNSSWLGDTYNGPMPNSIVYGILLPNDDAQSSTAGWNGWSFIPTGFTGNINCTNCHLTQTTAIGMDGPHPGDGSVFGPVQWSNMVVGDASAGFYSACANSPSWTNGGSECGNTPANPLSSVIQVSNQSLVPMGTDTVTIDNSSKDTLEVAVDPEIYVFPEVASAAAAAPAAAVRRPQAVSTATGCNSTFRVVRTLRRFEPLRYKVDVTCTNTGVKEINLTFGAFDFNDPGHSLGTVIRTPACGAMVNGMCSTREEPFPLVNGRSQTVALTDGYVKNTNGGRSHHDMGIQQQTCKEDASLHPGPPPGDFILQCFHVNDRAWPYPAYAIVGFGGPQIADPTAPSVIGFPGPPNVFRDCYGPHKKDTGCDTNRIPRFKTQLEQYYRDHPAQGYALPPNLAGWEAHHLLPLAWGGQNVSENGIWLPKQTHARYSQWWCYFSLDGRFVTADPPAICRPPFEDLDEQRL